MWGNPGLETKQEASLKKTLGESLFCVGLGKQRREGEEGQLLRLLVFRWYLAARRQVKEAQGSRREENESLVGTWRDREAEARIHHPCLGKTSRYGIL